ncbi:unnamed protein product [Kuraishia capsulata CBS 1993]|uniref:Uncharacterized protein n=1 Tax=Kuraishia capsulata CBS 1993 TaxID=1382522 RepID=W6MX42_9ASCO|nr:uncharacterized protein KUCA_T00004217001 [Kuraishia capsulata CBS 1993]CDK28235.1 unnamed protein product [Kuraishia capsulata CBS 1993]
MEERPENPSKGDGEDISLKSEPNVIADAPNDTVAKEINAEAIDATSDHHDQSDRYSEHAVVSTEPALPDEEELPSHQTPLDEEIAGNSTTTMSKPPFEVIRDSTGVENENRAISRFALGVQSPESTVNLNALSSFFSIDREQLEELNSVVVTQLSNKFREYQSLKSDKDVLMMSLEQLKHSSSKRTESLKGELKTYRGSTSELQQRLATLEGEKLKLEAQLAEQLDNGASDKSHLQEVNNKITTLTNDKKTAFDLLNKKQNEVVMLHQEVDQLSEANKTLRANLMQVQSENEKVTSEIIRSKFEKNNIQQELTLASSSSTWFKEELDRKLEELKHLREEKRNQVSSLQSELDATKTELTSTSMKYDNLLNKYNQATRSLDESLESLRKSNTKVALQEEDFAREMSSKDRLLNILKSSNDDRQKRISKLESLVESAKSSTAKDVATLKLDLENAQQQLVLSETKVHDLQETVANLTHPEYSGFEDKTVNGTSFLSQSVNMTASNLGGISLSQLLADFQLVKRQLINERRLKERMQKQVDDFVEELSKKVPIIEATKERCNVLEMELSELSMILEGANKEKEDLETENKIWKKRLDESEVQVTSLRKQKLDLSEQVSTLLIQITLKSANDSPLTSEEQQLITSMVGNVRDDVDLFQSDTDKLISERLVKFKNIVELTKNNEELLAITRSLGVELEEQERSKKSKFEQLESQALDDAKEAILALKDDLQETERKLKNVISERDMLKTMTASRKSLIFNDSVTDRSIDESQIIDKVKSLQDKLDRCQDDFDAFRKESNKTIASLTSKNGELTDIKFKLSMEVSHLESSSKLLEERHKSTQETLLYTKSTNDELSKHLQRLQDSLNRTESENRRLSDDLQDIKSRISRTEAELTNARSETAMLRALNARLDSDNSGLIEERRKLNDVISNLQHKENERDLSYKEASKRSVSTISSLEKELESLKEKFERLNDDLRGVLVSKEAEAGNYQQKIDALRADLSRTREQLAVKTTSVSHLEDTVQRITKQFNEVETKLSTLLNVETDDGSPEGEIARLKEQLSSTLDDLDHARRDCDEFRLVSENSERNIAELTLSFDSYKADVEEKVKHLEHERSELQDQVQKLTSTTEDLQRSNKDLSSELNSKVSEYKIQITSLESKVQTSDAIRDDYNQKVQTIQNEMQAQAKIASDAQSNYEQELQKHAEVARLNTLLREELDSVKNDVGKYLNEAESAKEALLISQQGWESQKAALENQVREASVRVSEVSEQNLLLLNQLQVASSSSTSIEGADGLGASEDLSEIINFLRREKEISESRLLIAVEDEKRLRQKLSIANAELQTVKSELEKAHLSLSKATEFSKDEAAITEKLYQLDVLRESNSTLRNDNSKKVERIRLLETQLDEALKKLQPLESQSAKLTAELRVKDEEIKLRGEQINHWKTRTDEILNSYDRDPELNSKVSSLEEELAAAKTSLSETQAKLQERELLFTKLRNESQSKLNSSKLTRKNQQDQIEELKVSIGKITEERDQLASELKSTKESREKSTTEESAKVQELEAQKQQLESSIKGLNQELQKARSEQPVPTAETVAKIREELEKSKAEEVERTVNEKIEAYKKESEISVPNSVAAAEPSPEALEEIRRNLEVEFNAKLEEHKNKIRVLSLEKVNAAAEKRFEIGKADIEKQYKDQIAALEEKLKKSEQESSGTDQKELQNLREAFEKEKADLEAKFQAEKEALKSDIQAKARKAAEMKEKLLLRKIENLTKEKNALTEKSVPSVPSSLPAVPTLPSVPTPVVSSTPEASAENPATNKRTAESGENGEPTEKRVKTQEL